MEGLIQAGLLCLSKQVGPLSGEVGEETAIPCQIPEKHCGKIVLGPLSSLLPSRWAPLLRVPLEQKLRPEEGPGASMGPPYTSGASPPQPGPPCVCLSRLGAATAGPTSAPTPPARGRPSRERPVSGNSSVRPHQHQGTAGQAQIEGRRPVRAIRPHLLRIPMQGAQWHSCEAHGQDPVVSSHWEGPNRDHRGLRPIRPDGPLSSPVRHLRHQGPGPNDSLSTRGGGRTCSSRGSYLPPRPGHLRHSSEGGGAPGTYLRSNTSDIGFGVASGAAAGCHGLRRHFSRWSRRPAAGLLPRFSQLLGSPGSPVDEEHPRVNGRVFQNGNKVGFLWRMTEGSRALPSQNGTFNFPLLSPGGWLL
ncbi:hypothetical protein NDU88_003163 [Pleurodeles waltl]|uniref:Uncharacterized protein n=1 Tax=Pleurodeles waltl TaxID=8319 RepID=A0AAV7PD05_PLEWA|nr:hypothetical protein NDU88_003163 [Pleurodeles waltl]